jgi:hypothetical protein
LPAVEVAGNVDAIDAGTAVDVAVDRVEDR